MAQVFDLAYGRTGAGKSRGLVELIKYLTKQTGKKARVYAGDGGIATYENAGLVDRGILDVVEFDVLPFPFTVMDRMVQGWMPLKEGPKKGKWGAVKNEDYIITILEGAAVLGKYLLGPNRGGLAYRAAQGELLGNKNDDAVVKFKDETLESLGEGVAVGMNTVGHYKLMQPQLLNAVKRSKQLPGWVIWTSHPIETADRDEGGKAGDYGKLQGKTIVGPDVGGRAPASWVGREFGNLLHFDLATKRKDVQDPTTGARTKDLELEYRIYTRNHFDPDGNWLTEYAATNRCARPDMMEDYYVSEKGEPAGFGLVKFYQAMAKAKAAEIEAANIP